MTTATTGPRFTFRDEDEADETRIRAARLLVRQAELLHHDVDPDIAADAQRPLPAAHTTR